uniref:Bestrophin homolog n=1 Tax=Macrostomum lignano TaxID=282301 RepID=A0A1I8JEY2_9PLAT
RPEEKAPHLPDFAEMTVAYSETISSSQGGVFIKILLLWKGSLYKLVYTDLIAYLLIYYVFNISYRVLMPPETRQNFELVVRFCSGMDKNIPLSFILGFFMYMNIPWLNRIAFCCYGLITGTKDTFEVAKQIRCSLMRYMNLAWILLMHSISERIVHRFSNTEEAAADENGGVRALLENINRCDKVQLHFRKLVTENEIDAFARAEAEYKIKYQKKYVPDYWLPLHWAALLSKKAMIHGYCDPRSMVMIMREVERVRCMMHTLNIYNDVMIPLVYTQVVIIAVYSYFLLQLFSQQFVNPKLTAEMMSARTNATVMPVTVTSSSSTGDVIDMYFPIFTVLQFLFLMGWLKVAMCVMNPFGDDDEDFHTSDILDYNLEITSRCVEGQSAPHYPEGLTEPSMEWLKKSAGSEGDNMLEYLDAAEMEFSVVPPPPPEKFLEPLQMTGRTRRERLQRRLARAAACCRNGEEDNQLVERRRRQQQPESP